MVPIGHNVCNELVVDKAISQRNCKYVCKRKNAEMFCEENVCLLD